MPGVYVVKANMSADDMIALMGDAKNSVVQQPTAEELESQTGEETGENTEGSGENAEDTGEGENGQ